MAESIAMADLFLLPEAQMHWIEPYFPHDRQIKSTLGHPDIADISAPLLIGGRRKQSPD